MALASPLPAQDSAREEEALFVCRKAYAYGFYEVSLGLVERFLNNYPASSHIAEAELLAGECLFRQNKYLDALNKFESLLGRPGAKSIQDAVLYWLGEVNFKGNNFRKAAEHYKAVIDKYPQSSFASAAYYSLGWCKMQEQEFRQAIDYFRQVEGKFPKEPQAKDASFKIMECLYSLKDYPALKEKAKACFRLYGRDDPRLGYAYFYAAEAEYYLNNFSEAVSAYARLLKISRDKNLRELSRLGAAWAHLKLKHYPEAEEAFAQVKPEALEKKSSEALLLGRATLLSETGRQNEARTLYEELSIKAEEPLAQIQGYIGKGECDYALEKYKEAVEAYRQALQKAAGELSLPHELSDKLHYNLAWAYLKEGQFKEAIEEFQKIAKESDDKIVKLSALCQIGDVYQDSGDWAKAKEAYDAILKDYPDSFYSDYVQYQLGMVLLKGSNYDAAVLSFLTLKRNYPQSKLLDDALYGLGLAYFQKQDYHSSLEVFKGFQEEFKESSLAPQAVYLLGTSLFNLGRFSEAVEVFRDVSRRYADTELAQKAEYEVADCYYQLGNEKEALEKFKLLRAKYPDSALAAEVMWWLGGYYWRHNDLELARRYFNSLIKDFPESSLLADAYYALGSTYDDEGKHSEALANFRRVAEFGKGDLAAQAAVAMANIYAKQDKTGLALKAYKDIVSDYPGLANVVYPKAAELLFKSGNLAEAEDYFRKSLGLVPQKEVADIQLKVGEVLEAQGKPGAAIEEYLKVTYLYAENNAAAVRALLRVGRIYEAQGKAKEARNIYRKVIGLNTPEAKYAQERIEALKNKAK